MNELLYITGENASMQHFSIFLEFFSKISVFFKKVVYDVFYFSFCILWCTLPKYVAWILCNRIHNDLPQPNNLC